MGFDESYKTRLVLGLGIPYSAEAKNSRKPPADQGDIDRFWKFSEPSLTLSLCGGTQDQTNVAKRSDFDDFNRVFKDREADDLFRQDSTGASSLSNLSVKREREHGSCEEVEIQKVSCGEDDGFGERKKLRLNKFQSARLEESFKRHSTLNPKQKQDFARELKLRPRQVEVWFQNRRARTKLKQMELDCEFLRKCCDRLTDENRRLHKELKELKTLKSEQPLYMQLPSATLTMCPSCERIHGGSGCVAESAAKSSNKISFNAALV
ncbi:homeobox-leucine zipper protein HAT22-like isoform X1 [Primulina eburnea]|uniref:homeobox-leucine zipper protein HAT22-like isoform X1 n=1 Tax=Primulina eburnea TaxID=1245227 RepID=UPI003C6C139C